VKKFVKENGLGVCLFVVFFTLIWKFVKFDYFISASFHHSVQGERTQRITTVEGLWWKSMEIN
jgi:hypothetical protein